MKKTKTNFVLLEIPITVGVTLTKKTPKLELGREKNWWRPQQSLHNLNFKATI